MQQLVRLLWPLEVVQLCLFYAGQIRADEIHEDRSHIKIRRDEDTKIRRYEDIQYPSHHLITIQERCDSILSR